MKTMKFTLAVLFITAVIFTSCKKENETSDLLSSEESADLVSSAVSVNSSGLTASVNDIVMQTESSLETNGLKSANIEYTKDTTITRTNLSGALITYSYQLNYSYKLTATNLGIPENFTASYNYNGSFDAPRLSSTNNGSGNITVTGLELNSQTYNINGAYLRSGSFTSKIRNKYSSTSNVEFTLSDVVVNKSTYKIQSGIACLTISGTISGKGSFSYAATLVFNGDQTATLTIKGVNYLINLVTGDFSEIVEG